MGEVLRGNGGLHLNYANEISHFIFINKTAATAEGTINTGNVNVNKSDKTSFSIKYCKTFLAIERLFSKHTKFDKSCEHF